MVQQVAETSTYSSKSTATDRVSRTTTHNVNAGEFMEIRTTFKQTKPRPIVDKVESGGLQDKALPRLQHHNGGVRPQ
eukprot:1865517-Amphidinium_carterae.1